MARTARSAKVATLLSAVLMVAACGDEGSFDVTSEVVSHETTQDILVFSPDAEGPWPVIWAMHGIEGTGQDMAEIATRLAGEGFVVFAPTFGTDMNSQEGTLQAVLDAECGYRFARSIAAEHGGDLRQPVTFVGWSLGASFVLQGGLEREIDPSGEFVSCFDEVPRADVVVAISGCHYRYAGANLEFDPSGWGNTDADVVLLAGDADTICAAWQSEDAADALGAAGFDVDVIILEEANHFAPIFHDEVDDEWITVPDDPAGEQAVDVILDAIAIRQDRN